MIEMNRSFLCGLIVASTTWFISLYLYWLLVHSDSSALGAQNLIEAGRPTGQLSGDSDNDQPKKQFIRKKYENEKRLRKISQRLLDELRPINVDAGGGELFELFAE